MKSEPSILIVRLEKQEKEISPAAHPVCVRQKGQAITMDAAKQLDSIRMNKNLADIDLHGNLRFWFARISDEGDSSSSNLSLPDTIHLPTDSKQYYTATQSLSAWASHWKHTGPMIREASALVRISPLEETSVMVYSPTDYPRFDGDGSRFQFAESQGAFKGFRDGVVKTIQDLLDYPISGVRIDIIHFIHDTIGSSEIAFRELGTRTMKQIIIELFKNGGISRIAEHTSA